MRILTLLTALTCASAWGQAFSIFDPAMLKPQASVSEPITFGFEGVAETTATTTRPYFTGPFTLPASGTCTKVRVYCSGAVNVSAAIYGPNGDGTRPGSLIATNTSVVAASSTAGWVEIPFNAALSPGTYYLGAWGSASISFYRTAAVGTNAIAGATATWPAWPATFSYNSQAAGSVVSINATVQP